jgi:hypothetical protein
MRFRVSGLTPKDMSLGRLAYDAMQVKRVDRRSGCKWPRVFKVATGDGITQTSALSAS